MEVEVVVYDQQNKVVEQPTQQHKPDPHFPWKAADVNATRDNKYEKNEIIKLQKYPFQFHNSGRSPSRSVGGEEGGRSREPGEDLQGGFEEGRQWGGRIWT